MRVVLAGGGTAGHISPALALADALRRADPSAVLTFLGTERGLETRLVPQRGYELAVIPPVPLPRSLTPRLLTVPGRLAAAIGAAVRVLEETGEIIVGVDQDDRFAQPAQCRQGDHQRFGRLARQGRSGGHARSGIG